MSQSFKKFCVLTLSVFALTSPAFSQDVSTKLIDKSAVISNKMLSEEAVPNHEEAQKAAEMEKKVWEALSGNWKVLASQWHGEWLPETIFKEFRYQIKPDGKYSIKYAELSYPAYQGGFAKSGVGQIKIYTDSTPFKIDITPESGPFKGRVFQGIIEIDNDTVKINMALPERPRPTSFTGKKGLVFELWLRQ